MKPLTPVQKEQLTKVQPLADKYVAKKKLEGSKRTPSQLRRDFQKVIIRDGTLEAMAQEVDTLCEEALNQQEDLTGEEKQKHEDTIALLQWEYNRLHEKIERCGAGSQMYIVEKVLGIKVDPEDLITQKVKVQWRGGSITWEPYTNLKDNYFLREFWKEIKDNTEHPWHGFIGSEGDE